MLSQKICFRDGPHDTPMFIVKRMKDTQISKINLQVHAKIGRATAGGKDSCLARP